MRHRHLERYLSAPLTFLTAVAQRTTRIRLGTSVIPLRFEHPIALAEAAATADLLSDGRLELGLSSGYTQGEAVFSKVYGELAGSTLRADVDAKLGRFREALRGDVLATVEEPSPLGEPGTELTVQPLRPSLSDSLYYGAGAPAGAERTGRQGLRLQLSTVNTEASALSFEDAQAEAIRVYRAAHAEVTDRLIRAGQPAGPAHPQRSGR